MTTTIRTKEVVIIKIAGAIDKIIKSAMTCKVEATSSVEFAVPTSTLTLGIIGAASVTFDANKKNNPAQIKIRKA